MIPPDPPARHALVVVNHGRFLCANALASLRDAADRWGADYVELRRAAAPGHAPSYERAFYLARPQPWDRVCVVDADVLVHHRAPSVFAAAPWADAVYAVPDVYPGRYDPETDTRLRAEVHDRWVAAVHARFALDVHPPYVLGRFVNAGLFVAAPAAHTAVFTLFRTLAAGLPAAERDNAHYEQALFNYCLAATRTPLEHLPEAWNLISPPEGPMAAYAYHFTGPDCPAQKARLPHFDWRHGPGGG